MTDFWRIPQKLAEPTPSKRQVRWPVVFCFRCEAPTLELIREDGSPFSGEYYEEVNGRTQFYIRCESESNPTMNGTRIRINLCGTCANADWKSELHMIMPFVVSGIETAMEKTCQPEAAINRMKVEYLSTRPVEIETYEVAHNRVNKMLSDKQEKADAAIYEELMLEREIRSTLYKRAKGMKK